MSIVDLTGVRWIKSGYSGGNSQDSDCVEVAFGSLFVAVRDSKSPADGALILSPAAWTAFVCRFCRGLGVPSS